MGCSGRVVHPGGGVVDTLAEAAAVTVDGADVDGIETSSWRSGIASPARSPGSGPARSSGVTVTAAGASGYQSRPRRNGTGAYVLHGVRDRDANGLAVAVPELR